MGRAAYEIRTVGEVPPELLEDFEVVALSADRSGSTIHVLLADDAELSGLLEVLDRAGQVLVEVLREVFEDPSDDTSDEPTDGSSKRAR